MCQSIKINRVHEIHVVCVLECVDLCLEFRSVAACMCVHRLFMIMFMMSLFTAQSISEDRVHSVTVQVYVFVLGQWANI